VTKAPLAVPKVAMRNKRRVSSRLAFHPVLPVWRSEQASAQP